MCFSAPVSFLTSTALLAAGTASIPLAKTRGHKLIAATPFLFAIQQFVEGLQWLVEKPSMASDVLTYVFLLFAFLLWPTFIPLAVHANEPEKKRRRILQVFCFLGGFISLVMLMILWTYPIHAIVYHDSIRYDLNTWLNPVWTVGYVLVVVGSFLVSSDKLIRIFGILTVASVVISMMFYDRVFTSVWCFFAALLSLLMYVYLRVRKNYRAVA